MSDNDLSSADPLGPIADEFVEALRQGKRPSVEEFAGRYPEQADEIRELLPALVLMEKAKSAEAQGRQGPAAAAVTPLQQLGDYQILREVGRGGMGVVYEAQQLSLGRHVAIKVLPGHALLDPRHLARFQREARSAAKLHHTNIVPVFGVGQQDGLHYYVMQFIQGLGLDLVLDELRRLRQPRGKPAPTSEGAPAGPPNGRRGVSAVDVARSLLLGGRQPDPSCEPAVVRGGPAAGADCGVPPPVRAADTSATIRLPGQGEGSSLSESGSQYWRSVARVGVQVADALAHAASQGILHRDIKPSNLLLDDTGNVWVTDFGLAKAAGGSDDLTDTGDVVGTLRYMAPERFNGQGDLRSDVYSLGLTLYELLTLQPAFDESDRNQLVVEVLQGEPVRPRRYNRGVPRDLETVVLKAIARDPAHRYQTPAEMAEDLKRFVEDRPVRARRISYAGRLRRWCRRNPLPAGLLAGIVLMFLAGFAGVVWQWREAEAAREDEKAQRGQADALRQGAETARDEAKRREGEAVTARDEAKRTRNAAARQAAGLLLDRGIEDARGGEPARALHLFVQALRRLPAADPESAALACLIRMNLSAWGETVPALEHILPAEPEVSFGWMQQMAFSPDGTLLALPAGACEFRCFRTDTGRPVGPPAKLPGWVGRSAFAADGRSVWVASTNRPAPDADGWAIFRIDPKSGRPVQPPIPTKGPVFSLAVPPDGRHLVAAVHGLHPKDTGPRNDALRTRRWRVAEVVVWDTASGRVVRQVPVNGDNEFAYLGLSSDGKSVTAWVPRESGKLEGLRFTVAGKEPPRSLGLHPAGFTPWGHRTLNFRSDLLTALVVKDGQIHRWSDASPGVLGPGVPAPFREMHLGRSPDGRSVVSLLAGRLFDTGARPPRASGVSFAHPGWLEPSGGAEFGSVQYSREGRFLATGAGQTGRDRRCWRLPRPHSRPALAPGELGRLPPREDWDHAAQIDPRGTRALLYYDNRSVRLVDLATGGLRGTAVRHADKVREVVFHPEGRYFATASDDATARVWESATGRPAGPPLQGAVHVAAVAFSPDGNTLAAGDYGGRILHWDWRTGKQVRPAFVHDDIVATVSFSPDGRYLAAIKTRDWSKKPGLVLWEVASGRAVLRVPHNPPGGRVSYKTVFRPDGRALAARNATGTLTLWEVSGGRVLGQRPLDGPGATRFSPDGRVVTAAERHGVRLLDARNLDPLPGGYLPHPDAVQDLAFSPDGALLLTGRREGSAQLWDVATRKPVGPPAVLLGPIVAVTFTRDGKTCVCVAGDGTVRRWPVPVPLAEPDLARLGDRVALMTGQRMDPNQGLDYVPTKAWRALRAKLVGNGSTALVPPRPDADWHDGAAADAEQDRDAFGAEWHLARLAALRPRDWTVPARRGRALAVAGRRDEAAAAYAAARRLASSPQVLADWLRDAAGVEEAAGRKEAGLWSLDRAIALTPDDWTLYALRAALADPARAVADLEEAHRRGADPSLFVQTALGATRSGDWKRAAALLARLSREPAMPTGVRYLQALACLKAGDGPGYRAACSGIARRLPVGPKLSPGEAHAAAMAFAIGPDATDDWTQPLRWIDHALARLAALERANPGAKDKVREIRPLFLTARGAVLYRAGRFADAAKVLRAGMSLDPQGGKFHDWLFLALAEHRLDHADAAREAAVRARAMRAGARPALIRPGTASAAAEVELLAAELDAALPPPGK